MHVKAKNAFFAYFDHFKFLEFALFTNWHWYCVYSKPPSLYLSLYIYDFKHAHYSKFSKSLDHSVAWKQDQIWIHVYITVKHCIFLNSCTYTLTRITLLVSSKQQQRKYSILCLVIYLQFKGDPVHISTITMIEIIYLIIYCFWIIACCLTAY